MTARGNRRRGFTLIEVLLVVFIIAALASLAAVKLWPARDQAKTDITRTKIQALMAALERYNNSMNGYPSAEQGFKALLEQPDDETVKGKWHGPYCKASDLKDAWETDLAYKLEEVTVGNTTRSVPRVYSFGINKTDDNGEGDDIRDDEWVASAASGT